MKSDAAAFWPVAIAGGGFSGTMLAAQLSRRGVATLLCDGSGRLGRGVAYSTTNGAHILNVPASRMSAWPDAPASFADWLAARGKGEATSFAKRDDFGGYLAEQLVEAPSVSSTDRSIIAAERCDAGWRLRLSDGTQVTAGRLVLAHGNQPSIAPGVAHGLPDHLFIADPWSSIAEGTIARLGREGGTVLLLGTGLTMVDTMLSLDAAGHRGPVLALSRRGLAPRAHGPHAARTVTAADLPFGDVLALTRWLRSEAEDGNWRGAVDQLRPHSKALWRSWNLQQQRRFLRHARAYWDVHRHRIAPEIAAKIESFRAGGRLEVVAGRLQALELMIDGVSATLAPRSGGPLRTLPVAAVFNCTGPLGDIGQTRDPLLKALLTGGGASADKLRLGLEVDEHSRAGDRLWALGPLTKGAFWEIVAVPDIREQCASVAVAIAQELEAA
jgi:uncharacterized NAD(P)/FAD-binding protein YdhS